MVNIEQMETVLNLGMMELGEIILKDTEKISFDIIRFTDAFMDGIKKAVEVKRAENKEYWDNYYVYNHKDKKHNYTWSNAPAVIDFHYLNVNLVIDNFGQCEIVVGFHDAENSYAEDDITIGIDLTENIDDLKEYILFWY